MPSGLLTQISLITSYLGMTISMWLGFYLLSRGNANRASLRIFMALLALSLYYYNSFTALINPQTANEAIREFAVMLALVSWHQLTLLFLPAKTQARLGWTTYVVLICAVLGVGLLLTIHGQTGQDPRYVYPVELSSSSFVVGILQVVIALATIYNVLLVAGSKSRPETRTFFFSLGLGLLTIAYGALIAILQMPLPRFVATIMLLVTFLLLSYSVARYQAMIDRRISFEDLPVSALLILALTAAYVVLLRGHGLTAGEIAFVSVLVISSHSIYDLVYGFLDRLFHRRDREAFRQVRLLAQNKTGGAALKQNLAYGLDILCRNLQAEGGFIAQAQKGQFRVVASRNSLALDHEVAEASLAVERPIQPAGQLAQSVSWLTAAYGAGEQLGLVGIGPRQGNKEYTEADLFWLEDFADQVGALLLATRHAGRAPDAGGEMLTALAFQPDSELLKLVEESLRNLNDYVKLGDSPLVAMLGAEGKTNIERGKTLHDLIVAILQTLAPAGELPPEPRPREWHSYSILHDAYVDEVPDREIMARLYISEGTFYRARRKALHGVARAILELRSTSR
jgi:hypothetical protein